MDLNVLTAISPIDGRYRGKVASLARYFSEFAFIRYRLWVEIEYFIALCELPLPQLRSVDTQKYEALRQIYKHFTPAQAFEIKQIEQTTNHDVKAIEYYLKNQLKALNLTDYQEFIHFGLTSQDVNNTALPLLLKEALHYEIYPLLQALVENLIHAVFEYKAIPMLARTHGQPASPTTVGKEFMVFVERLEQQMNMLKQVPYSAKFGGATGNFNAHVVAYPEVDWVNFANTFVQKLGLKRTQFTTQIEHYDNLAALFDNFKRINTILIDLCRDLWHYISLNYFKQRIQPYEIGSSAMPHKVNPIDFENAEGNLGIANALFEHFAAKLPISRLQRDLTDSTVLRNIGTAFSYCIISYKSIMKGLSRLQLNEPALQQDLEKNWIVVAEAIQTILRREQYNQPYEALKQFIRTQPHISQENLHQFIDTLNIRPEVKQELKQITPFNYVGIT
ncbi:MAG: adenylosuccinate lyase [Microscillaceae bacterium]|nr:adenylosuccinate lyase [Microscillaceae bacterium]MDW8460188.1 adenylosuccinate lyase [Cytophagales bacterium]